MSNVNLTAADILMLSYAPKFHTGNNDFQQFWTFKYKVNPSAILYKLYINEYIEIATIADSFKQKKTNELKLILLENNLKQSGKKNELIDRIVENINEQQLLKYFPQRYYCLTPLGIETLQNNPNIIFAHKHSEFELDINTVSPDGDIYAYILDKIEHQEAEYIYYNNWGLYRNCKAQRAQLAKLKEDIISEISYNLEMCYIDISGLRNGVEPKNLYAIKEYILNAWSDPTKALANGIIDRLRMLIQKTNFTYDDTLSLCKKVIDNAHLPFHLYSNDDASHIILQRLYGTMRISTPIIK